MDSKIVGNTERRVNQVGLGTWQFSGEWGTVSEEKAMAIMKRAVERGVNFFDTADVYGAGRSETLIGKFLKKTSESIFVATKLGRLKGYPDNYSYELFRDCTEDSLKRLGVEALDLTQLHCIPPEYLKDGEVFDWLRELKKEGKIKNFGASVESMDEALMCLKQPDITSLQIIFNIYRQKPIDVLFDQAKEKNVALIVRLPLASGLLSGKFTKDTTFPEQDHRHFNRDGQQFNVGETFAGLEFEKGVEITAKLKSLVPENMSMAQFALRWVLDHDAVSVAIPGASKVEHVESNAAAGELPPLPHELHEKLRPFYDREVKEHIRGVY